jgi:hypothetical protein
MASLKKKASSCWEQEEGEKRFVVITLLSGDDEKLADA